MSSINAFSELVVKNPSWEKDFNVYQSDDKVYKRIICLWQENSLKTHEYHATINTKTGDLFLDCTKLKIFEKNLALIVARPLHTCVKTLWHASIILPLAIEIFDYLLEIQTFEELKTNTFNSLADIVRTPAYGIAITIVHIAAVVLGCVSPNSLYHTRDIVGKLERDMLRIKKVKDSVWLLSMCFSPLSNILDKNGLVKSTSRFASSAIKFRREHRALCNDWGTLFPEDKVYISAAKTLSG